MTDYLSPDDWNGWHLDPETPALIFKSDDVSGYKIDLDRMRSSDDLAFWFLQVGRKTWSGALDGFAKALDDLLQPHQQMSSLRQTAIPEVRDERSYTPEEIRERVAEYIAGCIAKQKAQAEWAWANANFN